MSSASFSLDCKVTPEPCFFRQLNPHQLDVEAFGHNRSPKELLVWHTKTVRGKPS